MKTITIWQPWASLIIAGAKPYEFRGWKPPHWIIGERIVIHAAARAIKPAEVALILNALHEGGEAMASTCLHADKAMPILERAWANDLPWASGLGTAVVGEPRNGYDIAAEFGLAHVNDSDRHEHSNWGWPMLDIEPWDLPVPMRGFQGLWNWPTPEALGL